jgi:hypothetical protein
MPLQNIKGLILILFSYEHTVAYGPVARQRPRDKQGIQPANKQTAISEQRSGKYVPAETNMNAKIEEWCFRCGPRRGDKENTWSNPVSWGLAVELSSAREAEKRWRYSSVDSWALQGKLWQEDLRAERWRCMIRSRCQETSSEDWEDLTCNSDM